MMDETSPPAPQTPIPPARPWHRMALVILVPVFAALTLYTALPKTSRSVGASAGSGCDHTPDANGVSACPHGVDANGGCNMNAATAPKLVPVRPEKALDWIIPEGWTAEKHEGGMRYATLKPSGPGKVEVSVVVLPSPAGGKLANVNRWRGQIGLPPIGEQDLAPLTIQMKAGKGMISVFDLDNPREAEGRMVVGMLGSGSDTWFLKMAGNRASVAEAKPSFLKFLAGLRSNETPS